MVKAVLNSAKNQKGGAFMNISRKVVFIGSSTESLPIAEKIARWLETNGIKPLLWTKALIPGDIILPKLVDISKSVSGAVFVFNRDDKTWYRGERTATVRDNVLFEYGLFSGQSSTNQVIAVCLKDKKPKIPSDLFGVTFLQIDPGKEYSCAEELLKWAKTLPERYDNLVSNQLYKIQSEEIGFEYHDLHNATYYSILNIQCQVNNLRQLSNRYAWMYGGTMTVHPHNRLDTLIDQYGELGYMVYTLRLSKSLVLGEPYSTGFNIDITGADKLSNMFISNNATNYYPGDLKMWVKIPSNLQFKNACIKFQGKSGVSQKPDKHIRCKGLLYIERIIRSPRENGIYTLEWELN